MSSFSSHHNSHHHHNSQIGGGPSAGSSMSTNTSNRLLSSLSNPDDIAVWLHNKLSTDDIWSDKSSIISQLNADILCKMKTCFHELQLNVKLKLLLSFLHLTKRNVDEWKDELEDLIQLAIGDSDQWVSVIGQLLLNYPRHGTIQIDNNTSRHFSNMVTELKKLMKKQDHKILPLESLYLNRAAFQSSFGQLPTPLKHFTLNRRAKSATLRSELLQKAADLSSGKRPSTGTTVPIRCRGLNSSDSTPLKGIPSRNTFAMSSGGYSSFSKSSLLSGRSSLMGSSGASRSARIASIAAQASSSLGGGLGSTSSSAGLKRDGGIVLLDINEAPSAMNQHHHQHHPKEAKRARKDNKQQTSTATTTTTANTTTTESSSTKTTATTKTTSGRILGQKNNNTNVEQEQQQPSSKQQQKSVGKFQNLENNENNNPTTTSTMTPTSTTSTISSSLLKNNLTTTTSTTSIISNSMTTNRILASKSTAPPDYAAGLTTSSILSSTASGRNVGQTQQQQQQSSMYHPVTTTTTSSSMYHSQQSMFNNNQQQKQTATVIASSSQQQNQSLMNQTAQHKTTQPVVGSFPQAQEQQQNINYGFHNQQQSLKSTNQQPHFQNSSIQQQQQFLNRNQQPNNNQQQTQFQAPYGMYGHTTNQQQQQQTPPPPVPQPQQQRPPQQHRTTAEQFLQDIMTKFPKLNEADKSTIVSFLNGCSNPNPQMGSQRTIRLGETIEFRQLAPDSQPVRALVETQLLMDYDKKICKKVENLKQLSDFSTIRTIGSTPGGPRIIMTPAPQQNPNHQQQQQQPTLAINPAMIHNFQARPGGLTFVAMAPSGQLRPINSALLQPHQMAAALQQHHQQQQQNNQGQSSSNNNQQQQQSQNRIQYSHIQQKV